MAAEVVKMTRSGQITLPSNFRADLGIFEGDYLVVEEVGDLIVIKKLGRESLRAFMGELRKEARKAGITRAMVGKAIRELRE
jgi:AbrB family looped-hinge helix DNA binding protein